MLTAAKLGLTKPIGSSRPTVASIEQVRLTLRYAAKRERSEILVCAVIGVGIDLLVFAGFIALGAAISRVSDARPTESFKLASGIAGVVCGIMLLAAVLTKPHGRAERARFILDRGIEYRSGSANSTAGLAVSFLMVIALYGGYALVEAFNRSTMRFRLAKVDENEIAHVLAQIQAAPAGIRPSALLRKGQSLPDLGAPIAALVLDGWIDVVEDGNLLIAKSSTMRSLARRHPLADVFQSEPPA